MKKVIGGMMITFAAIFLLAGIYFAIESFISSNVDGWDEVWRIIAFVSILIGGFLLLFGIDFIKSSK